MYSDFQNMPETAELVEGPTASTAQQVEELYVKLDGLDAALTVLTKTLEPFLLPGSPKRPEDPQPPKPRHSVVHETTLASTRRIICITQSVHDLRKRLD